MKKKYSSESERLDNECCSYVNKGQLIPTELLNEVEEYVNKYKTVLSIEWHEWFKKYNEIMKEHLYKSE